MPYVDCAGCGRNVFIAVYWSSAEYCPHCDSELPAPPTTRLLPPAARPRGHSRRAAPTPARALAKEP